MSRSVTPVVWQQWRERLDRFPSSGLTVAGFCQAEGVSQATFYNWRKKLRGRGSAAAWQAASGHPVFVPLIASQSAGSRSSAAGVVLTLANGVRVELPADDHALVSQVVRIVAGLTAAGEPR